MKFIPGILILLAMGCTTPRASTARAAVTAVCAPARTFGAIPNDGIDDRSALQAGTIACAGQTLVLETGTYNVAVVAVSHGAVGVTLASNLLGVDGTVIRFAGNAGGFDWGGLDINAVSVSITNVRLEGDAITGANEHTPLVRVYGPNDGVQISYSSFYYPEDPTAGKRGDCVSFIGYAALGTNPDKMIRNMRTHHNVFASCARVGVQFHSGTEGEIDHNEFLDGGRAADLDGEGSGGSKLKIHHNHIAVGPHTTSVLGLQIQADDGHVIYDNVIDGKAINLYGCAHCELRDNKVRMDMLSTAPVLAVTKLSPAYWDHDNQYTRSASAGPGFVVQVGQRISAPSAVVFENDMITQHASSVPLQTLGIAGVVLRRSTLTFDGATATVGWDAEGITDRTTGLVMDHTSFVGPFSSVMAVTGSYGGTGSVTITDSKAPGAVKGLVCNNVTVGSGVLGPIVFTGNAMPNPQCGALWP